MKTATLVNERESETGMGYMAKQLHYRLSAPLEGYKYVVVSAANTFDHGPETYIFGADRDGEITDWNELEGSFVGGLDHERALEGAGYQVVRAKVLSKKKTKK